MKYFCDDIELTELSDCQCLANAVFASIIVEAKNGQFPSGVKSIYHHHHIVLAARISLTLSRHSSLSLIALGRSSGQQPVSPHSCWMYVRAGRPAFARPCVGIHKSTSLMSSSLLLQQCPACLVRLTWIVFVIGGRWPYSWCLVGCCCQDLSKFRFIFSIDNIEYSSFINITNYLFFSLSLSVSLFIYIYIYIYIW